MGFGNRAPFRGSLGFFLKGSFKELVVKIVRVLLGLF